MALRRITLYVDDGDLLLAKEAAARLGVSEAEVIREGVHRIAAAHCAAHRVGDEPFVSDDETFDLGDGRDGIGSAVPEGCAGGATDRRAGAGTPGVR
ncbi:hypothetical protein ACFY3N_28355 [Streptomyces sp. NPDC000348]|uniref:hypothetical protein n=1 Tax=Streptomyces sp. NPDC000348 TaxID=3364538 RepID=UPI0036A18572